jgi:UDP-N-acetylmuramoylalanine--D-glutamate ligase
MEKIVVLGGGESGCGAAILAQQKGFDVFVSDIGKVKDKYKNVLTQYEIEWEELKHSEERIFQADKVIKSPGIPETIPIILDLKNKGIPVISEIEFGAQYTDSKIIAITGSNGKTTTTLLIGHMLKKAGWDVGIAGNVGESFALQVANDPHDFYVLELSSFQLDGIVNFKPNIAILLNITPDHMDRYNNVMQNYINSKFRITMNQQPSDFFIYCSDDDNIQNKIQNTVAQILPFSIKRNHQQGASLIDDELIINHLV